MILEGLFKEINKELFEIIHTNFIKQLNDGVFTMTALSQWKHIPYIVNDYNVPDPTILMKIYDNINVATIQRLQQILKHTDYSGYVYGDTNENKIIVLEKIINNYINCEQKFVHQIPDYQINKKSINEIINVSLYNENEKGMNKVVSVGCNVINQIDHYESILYNTIFCSIVGEQFFNSLRTQQEIGYVATIAPRIYSNEYNYDVIDEIMITSSSFSKEVVLEKIMEFIKNITVDETSYSNMVRSLKKSLNSHYEEPTIIFSRNFQQIMSRRFIFNSNELLLQQTNNIPFNKFTDFVKNKIINADKYTVCID
jgi:secreted Zn-dependent insulinase-like peptidase